MLAWIHIAILEEPNKEKHYVVHETNETIDSLNVVLDTLLCDSYRIPKGVN